MPDSQQTVRIFISSPGDVAEEREGARRVVEGLRRQYPGTELQTLLWEDLALPATASFQETIDILLGREPIDIAVFILWSRLGSPLGAAITKPDGTPYLSGTEREFDLMLAAHEQSDQNRPVILAYTRDDDTEFKQRLTELATADLEGFVAQRKLADSFIREQFHDAEGRNLRAYHTYSEPIGFLQRLRVHLRNSIDELLDVDSITWTEEPYRGLETFDVEHAPIFYGREEETCDLLQRLRDQQEAGCAFVVIVGASGSGKSSLARAGVAANLVQHADDEGGKWQVSAFIPTLADQSLCYTLVRAIGEVLPELIDSEEAATNLTEGLAENAALTVKLTIAPAFTRAGEPVRLLLILDQMEELWTDRNTTAEDRESFLAALKALAESGHVAVLATLRSDFYHHAQASPSFLSLKGERGHVDLLAPDAASVHRLITEPARLAGLKFEQHEQSGRSLDEVILQDAAHDADALPLLEYTLSELYRQRNQEERLLTYAAYVELGGVEGAIGKRAEETFVALPADAQAALDEILPLLVSVDVAGEQAAVRRRAKVSDLTATPARKTLTDQLVAARFLTTDREGETPIASLAHEALLRSWDRIVGWINANRQQLRLRARVEQQQQRWEQQDREKSLLLSDGLPLDEGRQLAEEAPYLLTASTKDYIDASIAHQESSARKSRRVRTVVLSTIGALVVAMAVGGFIAWQINEQNQQQAALEQRATAASGLVRRLLDVEALGLKVAIDDLIPYRDLARAELTKAYEDSDDTSKAKLHAALALVGEDESALSFLKEQLLQVTPAQFGPVREQLGTYKEQLTKDYWDIALNDEGEPGRRFHAACALAKYDTENADWADPELVRFIANQLVGVLPSELVPWRDALRPVREQLAPALGTIYRDGDAGEQVRSFASDTLADYLSEDADGLFSLLADSNQKQFATMYDKLQSHRARAIELGNAVVTTPIPTDASEADKESFAIQQANAAVMLLRMDAAENVWPLLKHSPDPRVRSYIIHWLAAVDGKADPILTRYEQETDVTIKRALLLCLGEFKLPQATKDAFTETVRQVYQSDPDAGLHAAAQWLLRQWDVSLPELPVGEPPLSEEQKSELATLTSTVNDLRQQIAEQEEQSLERQRNWEQELLQQAELPASLVEGLVSHFGLDESEGLKAENSVEGQPEGNYLGPGEPRWVPGVVGQAVLLDGEGGQFDGGDGFQLAATGPFAYGCWFYALTEAPIAALFSKLDIFQQTGFDCRLEYGLIGLTLIQNSNTGGDQALKVLSDRPLSVRQWHHVFVVHDGSGVASGVRVYVNGALVPSSVADDWQSISGSIETDAPLTLGGYGGLTSEGYGGLIDEVRIYNRELNDTEVSALFRQGLRSLAATDPEQRTVFQHKLLTAAYQAETASNIPDDESSPMLALKRQLKVAQSAIQKVTLDGMRRWYVNGQGQTFVILDAGEFQMGSPETEPGHETFEELHQRQIGRRIALATTEVTRAQWRAFYNATNVWEADQDQLKAYIRSDDSPMIAMTWYEAAHYCNWLSEQEGIPEDQWCYETNAGEYGPRMKAKEAFWELSGYRLPTEGEWEYACRAKAVTSRYYGVTETLLPRYAWYQANGENQTHPVGSLKPNDYGLFDMQGNVWDWCYDAYQIYDAAMYRMSSDSDEALADEPTTGFVADANPRLLRGGSFIARSSLVRSAGRNYNQPGLHLTYVGLRPARTYHISPLPLYPLPAQAPPQAGRNLKRK